jgi:hypothetical protein
VNRTGYFVLFFTGILLAYLFNQRKREGLPISVYQ